MQHKVCKQMQRRGKKRFLHAGKVASSLLGSAFELTLHRLACFLQRRLVYMRANPQTQTKRSVFPCKCDICNITNFILLWFYMISQHKAVHTFQRGLKMICFLILKTQGNLLLSEVTWRYKQVYTWV